MTYSHDKTLLARLGFQDPDAKDPLHDLACEYMALEENVLKLRDMVQGSLVPTEVVGQEVISNELRESVDTLPWRGEFKYKITDIAHRISTHIESTLTKGYEQFLVVVGFLDVDTTWSIEHRREGTYKDGSRQGKINDRFVHKGRIITEVKIQPVTIGDLVRQMNLYQIHLMNTTTPTTFVVAVAFDVNEYYRTALEREHITIVRLGERFGAWATERNGSSPTKLQEF